MYRSVAQAREALAIAAPRIKLALAPSDELPRMDDVSLSRIALYVSFLQLLFDNLLIILKQAIQVLNDESVGAQAYHLTLFVQVPDTPDSATHLLA